MSSLSGFPGSPSNASEQEELSISRESSFVGFSTSMYELPNATVQDPRRDDDLGESSPYRGILESNQGAFSPHTPTHKNGFAHALHRSLTDFAFGEEDDRNDDSVASPLDEIHFNVDGREEQQSSNHHGRSLVVFKSQYFMGYHVDVNEHDWNIRFQQAINSPVCNDSAKMLREQNIRSLVHAFTQTVIPVAQHIIHELRLPNVERKIPSSQQALGLAGGDKYLYENVLYKLCKDSYGIYGGEKNSLKAAGHEYRSLQVMMDCDVPLLNYPLTLLITYCGHRIIASSVLPINSFTIAYGSSDAGKTIHNSSPSLAMLIERVAKQLNLKQHMSYDGKHMIWGPGDMECHVGKDGKYYVIDVARLFPPENPDTNYPGGFLYRLLRPEFVKSLCFPVSSDAFSKWGINGSIQHDEEVRQATKILHTAIVAKVANNIKELYGDGNGVPVSNIDIKEIAHNHGCNLRHLHKVSVALGQHPAKSEIHVQMIARWFKEHIWTIMRLCNKELDVANGEMSDQVIACVNMLFGLKTCSDSDWRTIILSGISYKFAIPVDYSEVYTCDPEKLFKSIQQLTGLRLSRSHVLLSTDGEILSSTDVIWRNGVLIDVFSDSPVMSLKPFDRADYVSVDPVVKSFRKLPPSDVAKMIVAGDLEGAEEWFKQEISRIELQQGTSSPGVIYPLRNLSELYVSMARFNDAEAQLLRILDVCKMTEPYSVLRVIQTLEGLGSFYSMRQDLKASEFHTRSALNLVKEHMHDRPIMIAEYSNNLASVMIRSRFNTLTKTYESAEIIQEISNYLEIAYNTYQQFYNSEAQEIGLVLNNMAIHQINLGNLQQARAFFERALLILLKTNGMDSARTIDTVYNIAKLIEQSPKQSEDAIVYYEILIDQYAKIYGETSIQLVPILHFCARLLKESKKYYEAQKLYVHSLEILKGAVCEKKARRISFTLARLGSCKMKVDDYVGAGETFLEAAEEMKTENEAEAVAQLFQRALGCFRTAEQQSAAFSWGQTYHEKMNRILQENQDLLDKMVVDENTTSR